MHRELVEGLVTPSEVKDDFFSVIDGALPILADENPEAGERIRVWLENDGCSRLGKEDAALLKKAAEQYIFADRN